MGAIFAHVQIARARAVGRFHALDPAMARAAMASGEAMSAP